jgi:hypothetical protein
MECAERGKGGLGWWWRPRGVGWVDDDAGGSERRRLGWRCGVGWVDGGWGAVCVERWFGLKWDLGDQVGRAFIRVGVCEGSRVAWGCVSSPSDGRYEV